jgi:hypothetical protein
MQYMEPGDRQRELAEKMLNGSITPDEEVELAKWYNDTDDTVLQVPASFASGEEELKQRLLQRLEHVDRPVVVFPEWRRIVAIAAMLIVIAGGSWLYFKAPADKKQVVAYKPVSPGNDIRPGIYGAVLQLPDGRTIVLDTAGNGALANGISKFDSSLVLTANGNQAAQEYLTLLTPRARQQSLTLSDGTRVWLNSGSSIRFPRSFTGNKREVEVTGETYFEVAHNPGAPFYVKVKDAAVEVLGTHFNIMAYENEHNIETTLVEGLVKFHKGDKSILLKPGQQTRLTEAGELTLVREPDVAMSLAWRNGLQIFRNLDIKAVMRQVERWYDVDVKYETEIPAGVTFSGQVPAGVSLAALLKVFETENIHFSIDANQHIVRVIH